MRRFIRVVFAVRQSWLVLEFFTGIDHKIAKKIAAARFRAAAAGLFSPPGYDKTGPPLFFGPED